MPEICSVILEISFDGESFAKPKWLHGKVLKPGFSMVTGAHSAKRSADRCQVLDLDSVGLEDDLLSLGWRFWSGSNLMRLRGRCKMVSRCGCGRLSYHKSVAMVTVLSPHVSSSFD